MKAGEDVTERNGADRADVAQADEARTNGRLYKNDRDLDVESLKALAHPLRVQIFDALSTYGSFTASGLAERLAESSGATSYHLRQLEKHGFVREVDGKGTSRERWWERVPGSVNIGSKDATETPAGRSAANMIFRQLRLNEERLLYDYVERAHNDLSTEWQDAGAVSTFNTRLTAAQLQQFVVEVAALTEKYVTPFKSQTVPGARPVHIVFHAFPVIDAEVTDESGVDQARHKNT
ncbi:MAG TPA: helix-turn-helix domain-containing protein [Galbitalea sp.]|jgi:DNA-binding transcriptional ArsR family regulator|nr:helix-turn-helix domain-containing protein [Galbitalea sp.]